MNDTPQDSRVTVKPCPFCGCEPEDCPQNSERPHPKRKGEWCVYVWCDNCDARGPEKREAEEAMAAWNRRASRPSAAASGDDELVRRLRVMAPEDRSSIVCENRTTREMNHDIRAAADRIEALTRAQPLGGDEVLAVADRLIDQQDEPWPGGTESDRLHYWRDKAIKAGNDIRAALTEQKEKRG